MKSHSNHNRAPESLSVTAGDIKVHLWAGLTLIVEVLVCGERNSIRHGGVKQSKAVCSLSIMPEWLVGQKKTESSL